MVKVTPKIKITRNAVYNTNNNLYKMKHNGFFNSNNCNVNMHNNKRNVNALSFRFRADTVLKSETEVFHMKDNYVSFVPSKLFKAEYGFSPQKYIIHLRIQYAKQLISTGYYSVKEIALMSGYTDYKYFSTEFKKQVGVSPSDYVYNYNK